MFQNHIRAAVDRAGGLTRTANELRVSNVTVHTWIKNRRVPNLDKARHLAKISGIAVDYLRPDRSVPSLF